MAYPYTHRLYRRVLGANKGVVNAWQKGNRELLAGYAFSDIDEDNFTVPLSASGNPGSNPTAWSEASFVTSEQATAIVDAMNEPSHPASLVSASWELGSEPDFDDWLASLTPPRKRILDDI